MVCAPKLSQVERRAGPGGWVWGAQYKWNPVRLSPKVFRILMLDGTMACVTGREDSGPCQGRRHVHEDPLPRQREDVSVDKRIVEHKLIWRSGSQSRSAVSDCLWSQGLQYTRILCPWDSPGKIPGVGCYSRLQGLFLTQGQSGSPGLQVDPLLSESPGEAVADLIFLGSKITADSVWNHKIKRHLFLGIKAMTNLGSILEDRDIT